MNADTYAIARLADYAIQQGARHGGLANMLVAAWVIRNRVGAGWQGGDWLQVLETAPEVEGNDYSADRYAVDSQSFTIRKLLEKIDEVYHGEEPDIFSGGKALYFADLTDGASLRPWFVDAIVRKPDEHERVGNVGTVSLFK